MFLIMPEHRQNIIPLFHPFEYHTVLRTIVAGETPGYIYADNPDYPNFAVAQFKHRVFLAGKPDATAGEPLRQLILHQIKANSLAAGVPLMRMAVSDTGWLPILTAALSDQNPFTPDYRVYLREIPNKPDSPSLPTGFTLRSVDKNLIETDFSGKSALLEEMCSERESVQAFLSRSFGTVAFKDETLAGWCLSEYNFQDRCEIGIATMEPFQRKGLAKAMTFAFLRQAYDHGVRNVLWHCNGNNIASQRTALSAGFHLVEDQPVLILYFVKKR